MRHRDFERIRNEFITYYKNQSKGDYEYYSWLKALSLDESLPYNQTRESFQWARDMISFLKEDKDNKYYRVLVAFPVKSMNGNVYKERDLVAAAMSMKGACPSLNHKDEFWFSPENPRNRWGNLEVVQGKYEDGAVECILKVPKTAVCPICNGDKMTELIDKKRIVNVSLEGGCAGGDQYTGACEGFTFNKKTFSLLTSDVLPGIPMARIFPIEAYMPFSRSSNNKVRGKKRMIKVVGLKETKQKRRVGEPFADYADFADCVSKNQDKEDPDAYCASIKQQAEKLAEQDGCPEGQHKNAEGECVPNTKESVEDDIKAIVDEIAALEVELANLDNYDKKNEINARLMTLYSRKNALLGVVSTQEQMECPEGSHWNSELQQCVADKIEQDAMPENQMCPDGEHWDSNIGGCVKNTPEPEGTKFPPELTDTPVGTAVAPDTGKQIMGESASALKVKALKAEQKARGLELTNAELETKLEEAYAQVNEQKGTIKTHDATITKLEKQISTLNSEKSTDSTEMKSLNRRLEDITESRDNYKKLAEEKTTQLEEVTNKYREALKTNLDLNKRLTETNEEYLKLSKDLDRKDEALKKAKNLGGKIRAIGLNESKK